MINHYCIIIVLSQCGIVMSCLWKWLGGVCWGDLHPNGGQGLGVGCYFGALTRWHKPHSKMWVERRGMLSYVIVLYFLCMSFVKQSNRPKEAQKLSFPQLTTIVIIATPKNDANYSVSRMWTDICTDIYKTSYVRYVPHFQLSHCPILVGFKITIIIWGVP